MHYQGYKPLLQSLAHFSSVALGTSSMGISSPQALVNQGLHFHEIP